MAYSVIFDMDGVIFDSERAVYREWQALAAKYGFEDLDTVYEKCIGVAEPVMGQLFLTQYGQDFPFWKYRKEQSENYHKKYDGGRLPLKPGIRELLQYLQARGVKTAVASSTRSVVVRQEIREAGLLPFFHAVIGGDMVTHSKPDPEIFFRAAAELGAEPAACFVVEDSYNGIRAARTAGMIPVMVPDMLPPDAEMREKASLICGDLTEFRTYLEQHPELQG